MKAVPFFILTFIFGLLLFLPSTFAQDYTQWNLPEGAKARLGKGQISGNIAYSPDGACLAVSTGIGIWLYDAGTYQEVALLTGHTNQVYSVAFSPDGQTLAGGSYDETIHLWDVTTGVHKRTLTGHTSWIRSIAFSPDGTTLASGSADGAVLLWEITPTMEPLMFGDVNRDGAVDISDLAIVGSNLGQTGQNDADVNRDGVVNIFDLVTVAGMLSNAASVP